MIGDDKIKAANICTRLYFKLEEGILAGSHPSCDLSHELATQGADQGLWYYNTDGEGGYLEVVIPLEALQLMTPLLDANAALSRLTRKPAQPPEGTPPWA